MPNFDYRVVEWSTYDDREASEVILDETTGDWDFYDSVQIHESWIDFVFRRQATGQP